MSRKLIAVGFALSLLLSVSAMNAQAGQVVDLAYGAGTVGSTINSVVMAHTTIINEQNIGIRISAEASGGGVDNIRLTGDGEFQISTAANISAWQAVNGVGDFAGDKVDNVLGLLPIYSSFVMIVVPKDSPIKTLADLKGKKVSVGVKGSGAEVIVQSFITGAGMTYDDFRPYFLAQSESNDGLKDRSLDALIYATGVPMPAIMELNATDDIRLIPVSVEEAEMITADYPFFSPGTIPAGTYDGMNDPIPSVQGFTIGFIRADVPDDIVYTITKIIWENRDALARIHASQRLLEPSMIKSGLLPIMDIHPGAMKYYKEQGWVD